MPTRRLTIVSAVTCLVFAGSLAAHDLFLRLSSYFVAPHSKVTVPLLNGSFDTSENAIARDRMLDVSIVGPADEVAHPAPEQWRDVDNAALLDFETGPPGTYTIGVSTAPRVFELSAEDFNTYLEHDGVDDVLRSRERDNELQQKARERYSKHVKAVVQVGDTRSEAFDARLGYPIEIVPLQNPYAMSAGDSLDVLVLRNGAPLKNQLVYASHAAYHGHDDKGGHVEACKTRTDDQGVARLELASGGPWYVRLIHMVEVDEEGVDYESNWATLTFELEVATPNPGDEPGDWPWLVLGIAAGVGLIRWFTKRRPTATSGA